MTATLEALENGEGPFLTTVIAIEGYADLITDGDPAAVVAAFAGASLPGHQDFVTAIGGLRVMWDQRVEQDPRNPFPDPPALKFEVQAALDDQGDFTDRFGVTVFRKGGGAETFLRETCDCDDTTLHVLSAANFPSSGVLHRGPEAMVYGGVASGPERFTGLIRGTWSPLHTQDGNRFARHHEAFDVTTETGDPIGVKLQPRVTQYQRGFVGRWCVVWLVKTQADGTLTTPDDSHVAYAGVVHSVDQDKTGATIVQCEHALRRLYETVLLRNQFRAQVAEGFELRLGWQFDAATSRQAVGGFSEASASPLIVVAGVPADAYEVTAGRYTVQEIGDRINAWLLAARVDGDLVFEVEYRAASPEAGGLRGRIDVFDTSSGGAQRNVSLTLPSVRLARMMGWNEDVTIRHEAWADTSNKISPYVPLRVAASFDPFGGQGTLDIINPTGEWAPQGDVLPNVISAPSPGDMEGILRVGTLGYLRAKKVTDTSFTVDTNGTREFFPPNDVEFAAMGRVTIEDEDDLTVHQVLVMEASFKELLLRILLSTGTNAFNHPDYDTLAEQLGAALPWSLFANDEDSIVDDLNGIEHGDLRFCTMITKPTRFTDRFLGQFLVRFAFPVWGRGRIRIHSWTTPIADYATLQLTPSNTAVPISQADKDPQRSVAREDFESIFNIVKFEYGELADGTEQPPIPCIDLPSYRDHGPRVLTIKLHSATTKGAVGDDLRTLMASFSGAMPMFSRPWQRLKRTIASTLYEKALPGETAAYTDRFIRNQTTGLRYDPATGAGGVSVTPTLVVGHRFEWGGPAANGQGFSEAMADVELMMLPPITSGPYCPTATVDHTAPGGGFSGGVLTFLPHAHSEASHAVDISHFTAGFGYVYRLTQEDPDDPTTALTWAGIDLIAVNAGANTATPNDPLLGFDATKRYRLTFFEYGATDPSLSQDEHAFQADDADGMVQDFRQPYGLIYSGHNGQLGAYTAGTQEASPARYAEELIGDGVALCTGGAKDIADLANNAVGYKTAVQCPIVYTDLRTFSGGGTYELIDCFEVPVSCGRMAVGLTRKLYFSPEFRSTDGNDAIVRITVARMWPSGNTRDDVVFTDPYVQATFTRNSTTMAIDTEQGIDIRHLDLGEGTFSGIAWVSVEINAKVELAGIAHIDLGPQEAV